MTYPRIRGFYWWTPRSITCLACSCGKLTAHAPHSQARVENVPIQEKFEDAGELESQLNLLSSPEVRWSSTSRQSGQIRQRVSLVLASHADLREFNELWASFCRSLLASKLRSTASQFTTHSADQILARSCCLFLQNRNLELAVFSWRPELHWQSSFFLLIVC